MSRQLRFFLCPLVVIVLAGVLAGQQGNGYLKTKVNPGRAGVFVDGKYVGPAANFRVGQKHALPPGAHEVKLVEPRYQELTTKVTITSGKTTTLKETLKPVTLAQPPFGRLRVISADKFAAVYVNGRYMGHADEFSNFAQGLLLNPGSYDVKVEPLSGGKAIEQKVSIEANKVVILK